MNKKKLLAAFIFAALLFRAIAENSPSISLEGTWSFSFSYDNKSCTVKGDKIVNHGDSPHFFKVALLLMDSECNGFPVLAYKVGEKSFSTLSPNYQYTDISFSANGFEKSQPKTGTYYPVIVLLCYKNGEYGATSYLTFPRTYYFENKIEDEARDLMRELQNAEEQERYWQMQMFGAPDGGVAAMQLASQYGREKNTIRSKLTAMNYNYYSRSLRYASTDLIRSYLSIPDPPPPSTVASYDFDYSSYDDNDYSSSGKSSPGMHQEWVRCSSCGGTGVDRFKTWDAPRYSSNSPKPWCETCKRYAYSHTHDFCHMCNGKGQWKKWVND